MDGWEAWPDDNFMVDKDDEVKLILTKRKILSVKVRLTPVNANIVWVYMHMILKSS